MLNCRSSLHTSLILATVFVYYFLSFFYSLNAIANPTSQCQSYYGLGLTKSARSVPSIETFAASFGLNLDSPQGIVTSPKQSPTYLMKRFGLYLSETSALEGPPGHDEFLNFQTVLRSSLGPPRVIYLKPLKSDESFLTDPALQGEKWKTPDGQSFQYQNVGSSFLYRTIDPMAYVERAFAISQQFPNENLSIMVPVDANVASIRRALLDRQIAASLKVTDQYEKKKAYLDPDMLYNLRAYDIDVPNANDYFVVLKNSGQSPMMMGQSEFSEQLQAVVRLARYDTHAPFENQIISGSVSLARPLPHEPRVRKELRPKLQNLFSRLNLEKGINIAELTRFNRFNTLPPEIMRSLMLKLLISTRESSHPVDLLILECDDVPSSNDPNARSLVDFYHDQFGFEILTRIDKGSAEDTPEYLMYLDTRSEKYAEVVKRLQENTSMLVTTRNQENLNLDSIDRGWKKPAHFMDNSDVSRIHNLGETYQSFVAQTRDRSKLTALAIPFTESLLIEVGTRADVVLVGDKLNGLDDLLKTLGPQRQIQIGMQAEKTHDNKTNIVLIESLAGKSRPQQLALLKKSFSQLRPGGTLTIIDNLWHFDIDIKEWTAQNAELATKNQIKKIKEKGVTFTGTEEKSLNEALYARNLKRKFMPFNQLIELAKEAGFNTQSIPMGSSQLTHHTRVRLSK